MKIKANQSKKYRNCLWNNFPFFDSILKIILNKIFLLEINYKIYSIMLMLNCVITDIFNITKNLLFILNKFTYSFEKLSSIMIFTDSDYYILYYAIFLVVYLKLAEDNGIIKC